MQEKPLDGADIFAFQEALTCASHTPLPTHTCSSVKSTPEGQARMVRVLCPASGQEPDRVLLKNVGHPTQMTTIHALCPGKCGAFIQWDYATSRWTIA